ncbi:MAG: GvpL/GvpF family gas vesicle protein, partial [Beijerinckiaceae bacterium]
RLSGIDTALAARDRQALGAALQAMMEAERARLATEFRARLAIVSVDVAGLPLADERAVLNAAVLIDRDKESELDRAVEAIDATLPDVFAIRYLGPLPAVSFASIFIGQQDAGALKLSLGRLGVDERMSGEQIATAYRAAVRAVHPDVAGAQASADATADLAKAYAVAIRAAAAPRTAKGVPLLLDIRREGEGPMGKAA